MATVSIEYFGMNGSGKTVTEAKRDAGARIEKALSGSYQPVMLESRGTTIILWRDPQGWHSNIIAENGENRKNPFQCGSSSRDYMEEFASALLQLAQITWDGTELLPPCLLELPIASSSRDSLGRRLIGEFKHWRGFQLAYRHAKANGIGEENTRHRWACEHAHEFAA